LQEVARRASVFARTSPEHKLRIVRALQAGGAIVAMTGDGVNDAPSLKQADVGTAMGRKGTEAAKEAAQMVLLDDNFASIVNAVHEGRTVYDNIRKVTAWTLPTNGGETLVVVLAIFAGFALPLTATQILWVNLILEGTLGLALALEPSEYGDMRRPPRRPDASLPSPCLPWRVLLVSILCTAASLGLLFIARVAAVAVPAVARGARVDPVHRGFARRVLLCARSGTRSRHGAYDGGQHADRRRGLLPVQCSLPVARVVHLARRARDTRRADRDHGRGRRAAGIHLSPVHERDIRQPPAGPCRRGADPGDRGGDDDPARSRKAAGAQTWLVRGIEGMIAPAQRTRG